MLNLYKIWQNLLKEDVSTNDVSDAIDNKYRVLITYDDEKYHKTGRRLIEPYAVGRTKAGNPCMRCFQYYGDTKRGVPKWKLMRLDRILTWEARPDDHFVAEPRLLGTKAPAYNEEGDKTMSVVFNQVKFDSQHEPNDDLTSLGLLRRKNAQIKAGQTLNISDLQPNQQGVISTSDRSSIANNSNDIQRGAISDLMDTPQNYEPTDREWQRDSKSSQQKRDEYNLKRRDKRAFKAADSRRLWRKESPNKELFNQEEKEEINNG